MGQCAGSRLLVAGWHAYQLCVGSYQQLACLCLPANRLPAPACICPACSQCEVQLEGEGPWSLPEGGGSSSGGSSSSTQPQSSSSSEVDAEADVQLLFTPGHTAGCVSLLYRPHGGVLFTGDHLAYSQRLGRLTIFKAYNWHSVSQQLDSVAGLRQLPFLTVLPGHGRRAQFGDAAEREEQLAALLAAEGWRG